MKARTGFAGGEKAIEFWAENNSLLPIVKYVNERKSYTGKTMGKEESCKYGARLFTPLARVEHFVVRILAQGGYYLFLLYNTIVTQMRKINR